MLDTANFIEAAEEDFIRAVFVNTNGTRVEIRQSRQQFDDGRVGLYAGGGVLTAQTEHGKVEVIVDAGAIQSRNVFKVTPVTLQKLDEVVGGVGVEGALVVAAPVEVTMTGDRLKSTGNAMHMRFELSAERRLQLGIPAGDRLTNATLMLVVPTLVDGVVAYQFLDEMILVGEALITRSPPFPGADLLFRNPEDPVELPPEILEGIGLLEGAKDGLTGAADDFARGFPKTHHELQRIVRLLSPLFSVLIAGIDPISTIASPLTDVLIKPVLMIPIIGLERSAPTRFGTEPARITRPFTVST